MNITHITRTKRFAKAVGVAATAVMAPALLFGGAGTAHADPCLYSNRHLCFPTLAELNDAIQNPANWDNLPTHPKYRATP